MMKCEICGKDYDRAETIRIYGNMSWTHRFCSASCYTEEAMRQFQASKTANNEDPRIQDYEPQDETDHLCDCGDVDCSRPNGHPVEDEERA